MNQLHYIVVEMYIINTWESGSLFIGTAYRVCSSRNLSSELIKNSYTMNHYSKGILKLNLEKKEGFCDDEREITSYFDN